MVSRLVTAASAPNGTVGASPYPPQLDIARMAELLLLWHRGSDVRKPESPRLRSCSPSLLATGSSEELLELLPRCTLLLPLGTPLHLGELLSRQEWPFSWIVRFLRFRNVHALSQEVFDRMCETSCAIFSRLCGPGQNTVSTSDTKWDRAAARHPASSICRARRALLHAAGEQEDCRLMYPIGQSLE
jgi:hypothetical protein